MRKLKTLLTEAMPLEKSNGLDPAKQDFVYKTLRTLSNSVKFSDTNKQRQFDNLVLQIMQLIKQ
jgi:hypothetical protein